MIMNRFYTPAEVAELLKTTRRTVYNWIEKGQLKSIKAGKLVRITRADLEEFIGQPLSDDE